MYSVVLDSLFCQDSTSRGSGTVRLTHAPVVGGAWANRLCEDAMAGAEGGNTWSKVRAANRRRNIEEFESGTVRLASLPRVLFIELTENCNLSCPMCRSAGPFDRAKNMPRELFDRVARELFPTAEIVDLRGWGESTILKDFPYYVDRTLEYGCVPRIVTNLTVPNEGMWRKLVRHGAFIAVSFDAASPETFAALRRGAKLAAILANLRILADEARTSGVGTGRIHLNVVVQHQAIPELSQIVTLAGDLGIAVRLNPLSAEVDDPGHLSHHLPALSESLVAAAAVGEAAGVEVRIGAALDEMWAEPEHAAKTCTHPWMYCYVNYRGQVGFCDHLIGERGSDSLLGELSSSSFSEIWNGPAYVRLRSEHAAWRPGNQVSARFAECDWCYRNRYVDFEEVTYPPYGEHIVLLNQRSCSGFRAQAG